MPLKERIAELKKERNAVILAHNYTLPDVQDVADFVGDSLGLSLQATKTDADVIVFCGVDFMAESAKILNPNKTVLHPDVKARCPMAAMCDPRSLKALKKDFPKADVVAYVNTSAACKAEADMCCTSSNAARAVEACESDLIIFIPDENLANHVGASSDKSIIPWPGFCPTHEGITAEQVRELKAAHPKAVVLAHPECLHEVTDLADFVGSTEGMVNHVRKSDRDEFIICTEQELLHRLRKENPGKTFRSVPGAICPNMKLITLENIAASLESLAPEVVVEEKLAARARAPLERMLALGRGD